MCLACSASEYRYAPADSSAVKTLGILCLHAATATAASANLKDALRDRRLAQPPGTCPDSDACSSRASATVTGLN